ncbi:MAG: hypothetical protein Q9181_005699 [Wetmoreana brouardii]
MVVLRAFLTAFALTCWQTSQASPVHVPHLDGAIPKRDVEGADNTDFLTKTGVNCMTNQHPDCWDVLKMPDYIKAWLRGKAGQLCGTQGFSEGFADCYVDVYKVTPRCSAITVANCATGIAAMVHDLTTSDVAGDDDHTVPIGELEKRQVFFTLTNIAGMFERAIFDTYRLLWYTASNNAAIATGSQITDIVNIASPPPKATQSFWKTLVIDSLLSGLAFLPGISAGKTLISSTAAVVSKAEAPARAILAASASVYGNLFPHDGSAASDLIDIATLQTDLSNFIDDLQSRFEPALVTALNNVDEFLKMTDTGAFSSPNPPSLPAQTEGLSQALTTYIISVALTGATWNVVVSPDTNVDALLSGQAGELNLDYGCQSVDAATGRCNAIWRDKPNNQGITMVQADSFLNNPYAAYEEYFGNTKHDPYTTPELLFVGAARCRLRPGWGSGVGVQMIDGDINFDCLSQMKVCTYKTDCKQSDEGSCLYKESDCSAESGYGYDRDRYRGMPDEQAESGNSFYVPPGYMGPFRTGKLQYPLRTKSVGT